LDKKDEAWMAFALKQDRPINPIFSKNGIRLDKPSKLARATVFARGVSYICTRNGYISPKPTFNSTGLIPFLHDPAAEHHWCIEFLQLSDVSATALVQSLKNCTVIVVSDGSYHDSYATAATIIEDLSSGHRAVDKIIAPGDSKVMSAYRAELT
jgi:hypothetical protein